PLPSVDTGITLPKIRDGQENSPTISEYDHRSKSFAAPVVLGENPDTDAHRNPTLLVDEAGFLYVFFGAHGHPTRVVKSRSPYDITAWLPKAPIDDQGTSYPQPWQLTDGEVFVSYRQSPGWCFRKSTDGASSWQPTVNLIRFSGARIYAATIAETGPYPRKVHIAWSKMGGGSPEEIRSKHLWARRYNVYYACSDDGGTTWRKSDGSLYTLPITEADSEKLHDSGQHGVWLKDIQLDSEGNPYVLFIDADVATYRSGWKLAGRTAAGWRISDVAESDHMYDAGALAIRAQDDFRIYAPTTASQAHEDGGEIEEWRSADQGATWTNTRHLTSGSRYSHNQVKVVFNHNHHENEGDFRVFWSYGDSVYPPATKDVYLCYYGETAARWRQIRMPTAATP
ncbi:MAG: BNR-4 repeat-containing protein, partial [Planctomycetota bacterium]